MSKHSQVNSVPEGNVRYGFYTYHISNLEGKILTLVEASIQDLEQRKALKDIARQTLWNWAIENNMDRDCEENKVTIKDGRITKG